MVSKQAGAFHGYSFKTAVLRNKEAIKIYIAVVGGVNLFPPFDSNTFFLTLGVGFLALVTKIAADAVDFYSSEVKLE